MSVMGSEADERLLEECIEALEAAVEKLDRFPAFVLALALRVHLAALLNAMQASGQIADGELRDFVSGVHPEADGLAEDED